MAGQLETSVREFMESYDKMDVDALMAKITADAQGVDELSRKWLRGQSAVVEYFRQFGPGLSEIRTTISDLRESAWGTTGVVTCWLEQDYMYQGAPVHFSGPMTIVLRQENGAWKVAVVHAVPLPQQASD
jgi:ketosteroid isomerase-like protein